MAVGVLMIIPGGTKDLYDKVMKSLGLSATGGDWPEGILTHTAGPSGKDWIVVDTWESKEAFMKFSQERLGEAAQASGMPLIQPMFFDIYLSHTT